MVCKQTTCGFIFLTFLLIVQGKLFHKANENLVVKLEDGSILGRQSQTIRDNMTYYAFEGIPYAKPPVGNLRFQPPVPNDKWNGILNATAWKDICLQDGTKTKNSEDCLYINVYTPSLKAKGLPVMVWIYGGTFLTGSGNIIPDYLLEQKDIILVSFNYRLGLLGFISTGDLVLPGNAGLKDQVLALKWVQRNIAQFGGDPQNITIFGESAGGVSVSYLLESNLTKGLFKQAIMQSGTALYLWGLTRRAREVAFGAGRFFGIFALTTKDLLDGLLKVDGKRLINSGLLSSIIDVLITNPLQGLGIGPVKEPEHEGALFTGLSHQMLSQGNYHKIPTIVGHNSQEALAGYGVPAIFRSYLIRYDLVNADLVPIDMNISNFIEKTAVGLTIKLHYFGILPIALQIGNIVQFVSDDQFNRPTSETVRLLSKNAPTFFYVFSYVGPLGSPSRPEPGVAHAEELPYLLYPPKGKATPQDIVVSRRMCKLWTNFAKYGNPTPQKDLLLQNSVWQPSNFLRSQDLVYLNIGANLSLGVNPDGENLAFYQKLYDEHGVPPYDTY